VAANVLLGNATPHLAAGALMALDADVLALTEFGVVMEDALERAGVLDAYPYRAIRTGVGTEGLATIARSAAVGGGPTIVLGDFNATRWHPDFRRLLRQGHLRDAHEWAGDGLGASWPADRPIPPFVRLDHILVRSGVIPTSVGSARIPGSDHVAMVADLAVT